MCHRDGAYRIQPYALFTAQGAIHVITDMNNRAIIILVGIYRYRDKELADIGSVRTAPRVPFRGLYPKTCENGPIDGQVTVHLKSRGHYPTTLLKPEAEEVGRRKRNWLKMLDTILDDVCIAQGRVERGLSAC